MINDVIIMRPLIFLLSGKIKYHFHTFCPLSFSTSSCSLRKLVNHECPRSGDPKSTDAEGDRLDWFLNILLHQFHV